MRERSFKVGDLLLREVTLNAKNLADGKLGPTWEGPYKVTKVYEKGAYGLRSLVDPGRKVTSSWNAMHLKKYYV